jgi:hypothetical protein
VYSLAARDNIAVLADQTKKDAKRRSEVLKVGRVFTISDFTGKEESDIEDLFEPEIFVSLVNAAYELPDANRLTPKILDDADRGTVRLVKKAEAAFNVMPESISTFDHFTPSAYLIRNPAVLDGTNRAIEATLARAEKLFETLNAALK